MLIYMNCIVYRRGNFWIVADDLTKAIIARYPRSQFMEADFFGVIRQYRDKNPVDRC